MSDEPVAREIEPGPVPGEIYEVEAPSGEPTGASVGAASDRDGAGGEACATAPPPPPGKHKHRCRWREKKS
ncbi:MAG: hypothetical protein ACR2M0_05670, partial [Chloroflexia bacterium]